MLPLRLAFFINDAATTGIYTLSLHDALPILGAHEGHDALPFLRALARPEGGPVAAIDRKSTRLNSSHVETSYAVFCLKKKKPGVETRRHQPIMHAGRVDVERRRLAARPVQPQ